MAWVDFNPVCLLVLAAWPLSAQTIPSLSEIVRNMESAECERLAQLPQYSDIRRYKFSSERFKKSSSEMLVRSKHYAGQGTDFEVLSSMGADGVGGRIFRHVMDAEREAGSHGENRVDSTNYNFELLGTESINGRDCYKLKLLPKKKTKFLLEGAAWIDRQDFGFVRIAGQPAASVSFWVSRPAITIEFEKVGQLWLVARNRSLAQARFLGRSELTIEYSGYTLANGADVATRRYASR